MTRWLDLFVIRDNEPLRLTWSAAAATDYVYCDRRESLKIQVVGWTWASAPSIHWPRPG